VFPPSLGEIQPLSSGGPARLRTLPQLRTSAPATVSAAEVASLRPSKKYKVLGLLGLAAVAAGVAFIVVGEPVSGSRGAERPAPSGIAAKAAQATATPTPGVSSVIDLDALSPGAPPSATNSALPRVPRAATAWRHTTGTAPSLTAKPTATPRKHDSEEPDVGY